MSSRPRAVRTSAVLESIESLRFDATTVASTVEIWKEGADESPGSLELDSPDCESEASSNSSSRSCHDEATSCKSSVCSNFFVMPITTKGNLQSFGLNFVNKKM